MNNSSPWIRRLLDKPENAFMCAVDMSYIQDKSNLVGLEEMVPEYETAVRFIIQDEIPVSSVAADFDSRSTTELVYGLVHARYVMTPRGVAKILEKYVAGCFGQCPRENCKRSPVLPIGLCDVVGQNTVRIFCPRCMDVYTLQPGVRAAAVDGAYFGTGLPHMVLMTRPEYIPSRPEGRYVAKLYGFRIHSSAYDLKRNAYRQILKQPSGSTSKVTSKITSTNRSTTAGSPATTNAAPDASTIVSSTASDRIPHMVDMIKTHRRAMLLKRY
ncbi:hypothetical protein ACI65C_009320 [Semiaphis heraclei]